MDFGARQAEGGSDHRNGGLRHVAERCLHRVQDYQRGAFELVVLGDNLGAARFIPWCASRHHRHSDQRLRPSIKTWNRSRYQ